MCCCPESNVNGTPGYRWQPSDALSTRPMDPPPLEDGDVILYDLPGRCSRSRGDCHSHHYRIVSHSGRFLFLLIQHGGGNLRYRLGNIQDFCSAFDATDDHGRYWLANGIYRAIEHVRDCAVDRERAEWREAAAQKRIKTRKFPARGQVRVWIEPAAR